MAVLSDILDTVLDETGFAKPSSYFGNSAEAAVRARTLANRSARSLLDLDHRALTKKATISMTTSNVYDLPADFRSFIPDTLYEDDKVWQAHFPMTDQEYGLLESSGANQSYRLQVRIFGGQIQIFEPVDGVDIFFYYNSDHPIEADGGSPTKARYTADNDVWLLDRDLHELDIIWRWKKLHGMEYQDDFAFFQNYKKHYLGRDGSAKALNFNRSYDDAIPQPYNDPWVN